MGNKSNNSVGRVIIFVLLGFVFGGILGESFGWLFGHIGMLTNAGGEDNIVRSFFIKAWELKVGYSDEGKPLFLDLYMLQFNMAFTLKLNIISMVGVVVSLYIMKWSGNR
ncbi:MAG: DUF4321 domain-containing protein [Fibromonadaceae bacterium]|nr:DUF4321 domain-containing protein [Fibromonadaceae bacterium]